MSPTFPLSYATLCSGVEAPSEAWEGLEFARDPVFVADNAAFPTRFLESRFPKVPNLGDITRLDGAPYRGKVDVLWASFPCQDFSEAGKGRSLEGTRGILTLAGLRVVDEVEPPVFCFENVVGLLNTKKDNAFGQFLGALVGEFGPLLPPGDRWSDAGYVLGPKRSVAWRVVDAQHFGVPQSRPRLYVVACPRGGLDPRRVLFERREEGDTSGECISRWADDLAGTEGSPDLAYRIAIRGRVVNGFDGQQIEQGDTIANCLRTAGGGGSIGYVLCKYQGRWVVRKLLPVEYERLQGMPDGYTLIDGATATARYNATGNSLAVPVVRWLGQRIIAELKAAA